MSPDTKSPMAALACMFVFVGSFAGCTKHEATRPTAFITNIKEVRTMHTGSFLATDAAASRVTALPYSLSVIYNGRPNGAYGFTQARPDFPLVTFWNGSCSRVAGGLLRTTLLRNKVGPEGGTVAQVDVPDAAAYQLSFNMMFASSFDFSAGGKVGFGLLVGKGHSGGTPAWDGNGGSVRLMWYKGSDGRVCLKPYVYHKDQPGNYGNDFGKTFPATGSLVKGKWYGVKIFVKSNNGSSTDGRLTITIAGVRLLDQPIRWTTNDLQRRVKHVIFETFRGGLEPYWQSATDGNIYFNNVAWNAM